MVDIHPSDRQATQPPAARFPLVFPFSPSAFTFLHSCFRFSLWSSPPFAFPLFPITSPFSFAVSHPRCPVLLSLHILFYPPFSLPFKYHTDAPQWPSPEAIPQGIPLRPNATRTTPATHPRAMASLESLMPGYTEAKVPY